MGLNLRLWNETKSKGFTWGFDIRNSPESFKDISNVWDINVLRFRSQHENSTFTFRLHQNFPSGIVTFVLLILFRRCWHTFDTHCYWFLKAFQNCSSRFNAIKTMFYTEHLRQHFPSPSFQFGNSKSVNRIELSFCVGKC